MTTGILQGDGLSSIVFYLAGESLIRCAKSHSNGEYPLFGTALKATAYADDISLVDQRLTALQTVVDAISRVAAELGLRFNGDKCASLTITRGRVDPSRPLVIEGQPIRALNSTECKTYLGVPIGAKLLFRPATSLPENLTKVMDSGLAPWQKLEFFREHLLPSLAHHLVTMRVEKSLLHALDKACANFPQTLANVPHNAHTDFLYVDRRASGLGACKLSEDADIWTIARAVQLKDSGDAVVRDVERTQANKNIFIALKTQPTIGLLPDYLSGSQERGLYNIRFVSSGANSWSRARRAATRLGVRIDVSSDDAKTKLVADDVSVTFIKAVRGLRSVVRNRHTLALSAAPHQEAAARGLLLETKSKDMARLVCRNSALQFGEWKIIH